ncbi:enoyl-CoA hydratase [Pelistega indica]|uniref:3-hydroxyisobutyryl-CoA hydrolase n=1 Tax=Pelistega indica TaxID=1414851 RepID=V8G6J7_9BURK|nr:MULTISPECIES: enoyl-CoA hydratase/isomerase family protein [Pelistega]ETD71706.1 enoyl-CoA hydratase [Pelistega indica]
MSSVVLFETINASNGFKIAVATLNQPQVLNGFSVEMAQLLQEKMTEWEQDSSVVAIILQGAGGKAFCAGGDLHALYKSMLQNQEGGVWQNQVARDFFSQEYRLDYHIHVYSKPVVCYGDGIVMGGGMGLMMGASHRIVTETTRMAMPEISIGLFPDVGGSWMLNRLPGLTGRFLAATGAQIGANDALFTHMANFNIKRESWAQIIQELTQAEWFPTTKRHQNDDLISAVLHNHSYSTEKGPLETNYAFINKLCQTNDLEKLYGMLVSLANHEDPWLSRAAQTLQKGSPLSFVLAMDLLEKTKHSSLADVFRLEFNVAMHAAQLGEFQEGIRALLIDKDKQPDWKFKSVADVSSDAIDYFFEDPVPEGEEHPLANL